ncbi:MAG: DNA gyrase inhibitor YacG [Betaproteobacteria bacterium]|nr:DNA gyrase inhibitor YacG [Betaproteobacteria bacterium]
MTIKTVSCPSCSAPVEWSAKSAFRPFCSERCKLQYLGAWATERYRIPESGRTSQDTDATSPPAS